MPYKPRKLKNKDYGANIISYKGQTIEVPYNCVAERLTYVQCSCGRIVQRQSYTISHIKTKLCQEWHFQNPDKLRSFTVRKDINDSMEIK